MSDQSDVEQTLASLIAAVLYPTGSFGPSVLGPAARVYRGWPDTKALATDLANGTINISVAADAGSQTTTTRYPDDTRIVKPMIPTLSGTVQGEVAVFDGDAAPGQLAGLLVDGFAAVHRTVGGDDPVTVAIGLATALASRNAMASGPSVVVLGVRNMTARVVADQPGVRELRRQRQVFRVACWCPDPASRDATASVVDAALADIPFLTLPDGFQGRIRFVASVPVDRAQAAGLYRRDLTYSVEYATTQSLSLPSLLFGNARIATSTSLVTNHLS